MDAYEVIRVIGKGSFGSVAQVRRKADGKEFVWKEISFGRMNEREKQQLVAEVNILRELKHPNIVRYDDRIIDREQSKIFIVMEFCKGGDLAHLIRQRKKEGPPLTEEKIWEIYSQVVQAIQVCHTRDRKILHRDIKPGNIFLDTSLNVKLGDFGLSRIMSEDSMFAYTHVGTPFYMSPEQICEGKYNEKSDIWALGCLLYEMAALAPPFEAKSQGELNEKITAGRVGRLPSRYSTEMQRVVQWLLTTDHTHRPNIGDIINVPQIAMKLRDRKIKESQISMKRKEKELQEKEDEIRKGEEELKTRESALLEREAKVAEQEKILAERQISVQKPEEKKDLVGFRNPDSPVNRANTPTNLRPKPAAEIDVRKLLPRGRNISPYENARFPRRDLSGDKRSFSPKTTFDRDGIRPRTAVPRSGEGVNIQQIDKFIQDFRQRPKTAVPKVPKKYNTLHA